jgi:hypothetical protein
VARPHCHPHRGTPPRADTTESGAGQLQTARESLLLIADGYYTKRTKQDARVDRAKLHRIGLPRHDLRQEGACRLLGRVVDIRVVQLMLRYASVPQVPRYLNPTDELRRERAVSWKRRTLRAVAGGHDA